MGRLQWLSPRSLSPPRDVSCLQQTSASAVACVISGRVVIRSPRWRRPRSFASTDACVRGRCRHRSSNPKTRIPNQGFGSHLRENHKKGQQFRKLSLEWLRLRGQEKEAPRRKETRTCAGLCFLKFQRKNKKQYSNNFKIK